MTVPAARPGSLPPPQAALLRARGPLDLVDDGFAALRAHPGLLLGTGALFLVPLTAIVALVGEGDPTPGLLTDGSWVAGLLSVLGFTLAPALMGLPLARAVALQAAGEPIGWRAAYALPWRRWATVIAAWAVLVPVKALALLFGGIPVLAVSALVLPLSAVIAVEGPTLGPALRRTGRLGRRAFGRGLGVVLLQHLAGWFLTGTLGFLPAIAVAAASERWQRPLANLAQLAAGLLVCPPAAWTAAAFYLDERIRRDGIDLYCSLDEWEAAPARRGRGARTAAQPVPVAAPRS